MFPLGTPLLPGRLLPLRLFEPRYLALLRECLSQESPEFGVVLIEATPRPSGDVSVLAVGRRRLRVVEWLPDDPHPWAMIEDWSDESDGSPAVQRTMIQDALARVRSIAALSGSQHGDLLDRLEESVDAFDSTTTTYALAGSVGFGASDQHRLLLCPGVTERLTCMMELLDDLEAVIRFHQAPNA
ncbi:MAG: LON peptidase substrate-binding domain-containing protein [Ilumatobacteraceae bacterium]